MCQTQTELLEAVRAADAVASKTNIKPAGQPWQRVYAIPEELWDRVREALETQAGE